jgi:hypothetical protein
MMPSDPDDPEWVSEKMFGEEFDSPIVYYVVDISDHFILFYGSFQDCQQMLNESHAGYSIVDYSQLTEKMYEQLHKEIMESLDDSF